MTSKSAAKLIPSDSSKVSVIRDITSNITTISAPFSRFGVMKIGSRATLVKLSTGNVAVFSPTELTPEVQAKVSSMGDLRYIVAPDFEHHIWVSPWSKQYPSASVIGVDGLPEKREKDEATRGIKFHTIYTAGNKRDNSVSPEFDAEFEVEYFHAHANKELVFLHKPSRTMIEADLLFNLPATEQYSRSGEDPTKGIFARLAGYFFSAKGEMLPQRRLLYYGVGGKDRKAFADSARKVMAWDFDRIIPCHGDVIETGGKSIIEKATAWHRGAH